MSELQGQTRTALEINQQLKAQLKEVEEKLTQQKKELQRNQTRLVTKIKTISLKSNGKITSFSAYKTLFLVSKNREKAFGVKLRTLLDRHKARTATRCLLRWFEHVKLIQIHNLYKEDMLANQEEFVYVTWQERERNRLAMAYLNRAKKRAETAKSVRKFMKERDQTINDEQGGAQKSHETELETAKSQISFDPQKLS